MTLGQTSVRLILSAAILICLGCTSRNARLPFAKSGDEVLPSHNAAQLLAAARQYEKEGQSENATRYYRQVLVLEPNNREARQGLHLVQSGQLRTDTGYDEIVAAGQPGSTPQLRSRDHLASRQAALDERTARLIANAVATAEDVKPASDPSYLVTVTAANPTRAEPEADIAETDASDTTEEVVDTSAETSSGIADTLNVEVVTVVPAEPEFAKTSAAILEASAEALPKIEARVTSAVSDSQPSTLKSLCTDANAAVLREVAKLDSHDPEIRKDGLRSLARIGPDASSATAAVRSLLNNEEHDMVSGYATWATWEITRDAVATVPALTALLSSSEPEVVQFAIYTLSDVGEQAQISVPALNQLLHSSDKRVRLHAAEAIAKIAPAASRAEAIETLVLLTAEPSPQLRTLALVALGSASDHPSKSLTTALTSALHDNDAAVRAAAALSLGGIPRVSESVIAQLKFVADNDQQEVRQAAAAALDCITR